MIKVGQKVKEVVTGFTGIVTGRAEYLTGCAQILIQPPCQDGKYTDSLWFDETRCEIVEAKPVAVPGNRPDAGPDKPAPKR